MDENDELVKEFLIESYEYLDSLDEDIMSLETDPTNPDLLARIFRAMHTIKGTGGFLDFNNLVSVAHAGESLLDCLRSGEVFADNRVVSVLLDLVDAIREVLAEIEQTGRDGEKIYAELVKSLNSLQGDEVASVPHEIPESPTPATESIKQSDIAAPPSPVLSETPEEPGERKTDSVG